MNESGRDRLNEVGKIKNINSSVILESLKIIKKGKVFDLGMEVNKKMYGQNPAVFPFSLIFESTPEDSKKLLQSIEKDSKLASSNEIIINSTHTSTHIDALCHSVYEDKVIGEFKVQDIREKDGWKKFGVETIPPIVGRGVLLDIAKYLGKDKLDDSHEISLEEIKNCLQEKKIKLKFGDIVCIRTGKTKDFYKADYLDKGPGISAEGAEWLAKNGMCVIGIDYASIDPLPWKNFNRCAHLQMLYKNKIYVIEALNLEELSRENISEFFIICSAPKFTGCSGIWVRPIAII